GGPHAEDSAGILRSGVSGVELVGQETISAGHALSLAAAADFPDRHRRHGRRWAGDLSGTLPARRARALRCDSHHSHQPGAAMPDVTFIADHARRSAEAAPDDPAWIYEGRE